MASVITVQHTCDMAKHATKPVEAVEREVVIQAGDVMVELDLCPDCAKTMAEVMVPYLEAGRPVSRRDPRRGGRGARMRSRSSASGSSSSGHSGHDPKDIREWAKGQGMSVSTRGRIPEEVLAAYEAVVGG